LERNRRQSVKFGSGKVEVEIANEFDRVRSKLLVETAS
jgi:hypothetical protein